MLEQIHATNRTPWAKAEADTLELADPMALASDSEEAPLAGGPRGVAKDAETGGGRVRVLVRRHGALLAFALFLMTALSCTTVLLDVWGPRAFTRLLYGEGTALKYGTLLLFNVGDLIGIVVSIAVVDRIGRRGCFAVGFLLQAALLTTLVLAHSMVETFGAYHCAGGTVQKVEALRGWEHCKDQGAGALALLTFVGMLATGCRCFGWEAAQLWIVEAFPTSVRATAVSLAQAAMRIASVGALALSGAYIDDLTPSDALLVVAAVQAAAGVVAIYGLPRETAGSAMSDAARDRPTPRA